MDASEAAAYLGVGLTKLRDWEREQNLPVHRLGSGPKAHRRFYRSELDTWLRSRCTANPPDQGRPAKPAKKGRK